MNNLSTRWPRALGTGLLALALSAAALWSVAAAGHGVARAAEGPPLITLYQFDRNLDWVWSASHERPRSTFAVVTDAAAERQLLASLDPAGRAAVERAIRGQQPDYARGEAVVVAYLGERPTAGYFVKVRRVDALGADITVQFAARSPSSGEMVAQVLEHPVDVVKIARRPEVSPLPWRVRFIDQEGRLVAHITVPVPAPQPPELGQGPAAAPRSIIGYRLAAGETLNAVARRFGTTAERLIALNPGIDPWNLAVGQRIKVDAERAD